MKNPMEGKYIDATTDEAVHDAIVALIIKKTGCKRTDEYDGLDLANPFKEVDHDGDLVGYTRRGHIESDGAKEISLAELEAMPDYVEPATEMTVAEVSKALGRTIKIIE